MAHPRRAIDDSVQRSGSTTKHGGELQELRKMNGGVSVVKYSLSGISMDVIVLAGTVVKTRITGRTRN